MDTATYNPESDTFTLKATSWHDTYPVSDLPKWLRFYRRMKSDFPKAGNNYDGGSRCAGEASGRTGRGGAEMRMQGVFMLVTAILIAVTILYGMGA